MVQELTDADFDTTITSGVTLVDLWAPWCGPCHMQTPIIEKLAEEYADRVTVCKLNVDENQQTAIKYGIMSIPTTMIFKDGERVQQFVGVQPEERLRQALDEHLA
ncbi:MAG: thioredoxin [Planctomycetota bacterium]